MKDAVSLGLMPSNAWPRVRSTLLGIVAALVWVAVLASVILTSDWAAERVRQEIIGLLEARFDATVSVGQLSLSLFPRVAVDGRDLVLTRTLPATWSCCQTTRRST